MRHEPVVLLKQRDPAAHGCVWTVPLEGCTASRMCSFAEVCAAQAGPIELLDVVHRKVVRGGQLFRIGEPFRNLFSVRSGFFKTLVVTQDGREQVTGFHMAGDFIGLDGIGSGHHASQAVALEDSEVCVFPFARLGALAVEVPELHERLHAIMGRELVREHLVMVMLGSMSAEEKVAAFLVDLTGRLHQRGWSSSEIVLRMTRHEIGSYLGLTLESVSRALSVLAALGVIHVKLRNVKVLDADRLRRLASCRVPMARPPRRLDSGHQASP